MVSSDAEARAVVERARRAGGRPPALGLLGGDLCRTLGGRGDEERIRHGNGRRLTIDIGSVLVDGRQQWFVAHLVARRSWWHGRIWAVMNAEFIGNWDVATVIAMNDALLIRHSPQLQQRMRTGCTVVRSQSRSRLQQSP